MNIVARQRLASWSILAALLLSLVPAAGLTTAARAEGRSVQRTDQTSANPNEEIVYLDANGFVRVLDVEAPGTPKAIQFVSPEGGWRSVGLGDFNNNGDMEIVVVKGDGGSTSLYAVYDPVVTSGPSDGQFNGVNWRQLVRAPLPDRPEMVGAGDFDVNVDGDEIVVVRETIPGEAGNPDDWRVEILKQTTADNGDGTAWTYHQHINTGDRWDRMSVGNVDNAGGEEIVLAGDQEDEDDGRLIQAFQPDKAFRRIFDHGSDCRLPRDATFAQYFAGGSLELLTAVRPSGSACKSPENAFRIYTWNNDTFPDPENMTAGERFDPEARTLFAGDINGNGDDEAIMLRRVNSTDASAARLIVRGNGDDQIIADFTNGLPLDSDNGYEMGAAGDIDGDGKDEIVLIRDNNIRYYPEAHNSAQAVNVSQSTNKRSIAIGDLDAAAAGPVFATSISKIEAEAKQGFVSSGTFLLNNGATDDALPFAAYVQGGGSWLVVSPSFGNAPGFNTGNKIELTYTIDARGLIINQTYNATIVIASNGTPQAQNAPVQIPVTVKVVAPPFEAIPPGANAQFIPCGDGISPQDVRLTISGLPGTRLRDVQVWPASALAAAGAGENLTGELLIGARSADGGSLVLRNAAGQEQVLAAVGRMNLLSTANAVGIDATTALTYPSQVPWITSISVNTTTLPSQLTLTIDPTQRNRPFERAGLVLIGPSYDPNNPIAARSYPINLVCTDWGAWLPIMRK